MGLQMVRRNEMKACIFVAALKLCILNVEPIAAQGLQPSHLLGQATCLISPPACGNHAQARQMRRGLRKS